MERVNLTFVVLWRFKDFHHLKITKCKKIIDCKKGKILNYGVRGYFINEKYYKRNKLKPMIEKIPKFDYNPFGIGKNILSHPNQFIEQNTKNLKNL